MRRQLLLTELRAMVYNRTLPSANQIRKSHRDPLGELYGQRFQDQGLIAQEHPFQTTIMASIDPTQHRSDLQQAVDQLDPRQADLCLTKLQSPQLPQTQWKRQVQSEQIRQLLCRHRLLYLHQ